MEGELSNTIEAIDGVDTAIVHLALPEKQVFADEQAPATASVLVDTSAGTDLDGEQVQAIVNVVASSIDGLDPEKVTVADADGRVLTANDGSGGNGSGTRAQAVEDFQTDIQTRVQAMLDRVVGPGNSTLTVTADLDFDKAVTESTTYSANPDLPALSESESSETYTGPAGAPPARAAPVAWSAPTARWTAGWRAATARPTRSSRPPATTRSTASSSGARTPPAPRRTSSSARSSTPRPRATSTRARSRT